MTKGKGVKEVKAVKAGKRLAWAIWHPAYSTYLAYRDFAKDDVVSMAIFRTRTRARIFKRDHLKGNGSLIVQVSVTPLTPGKGKRK